MTAAEALVLVKLHGCTADFPVVSDADAAVLIAQCKVKDSSGRLITDDDYEETYHIPRALRSVWLLKAGRVATSYTMTSGDQTLNRSEMSKACIEMANLWGRQCTGSAKLPDRYSTRVIYPKANKDDV